MPTHVVFSDRAMTSLLVEIYEKINTETGGVFLGYRKGDVWYVIEAIDPGPKSTFQVSYFEYDQDYINHLINKVSRLYKEQLDLIGLWHRHPGSFDSFSSTDDGTNKQYALLHEDGAISALVNIDPTFRLTVYEVKQPVKYRKISYTVGDEHIPIKLLEHRPQKDVTAKINNYNTNHKEKPGKTSFRELLTQQKKHSIKSDPAQEGATHKDESSKQRGLTFNTALHEYLRKRTYNNVVVREVTKVSAWSDGKIETILEQLADDLDFLPSIGIDCSMTINDSGYLELNELLGERVQGCPVKLLVDSDGKTPFFTYNEYSYLYHSGLFKEAFAEHYLKGGNA